MKRTIFLFILFSCSSLFAQEVEVVLPKSKVTAGSAFQLQVVITGASTVSVDPAITFPGFQLVSGPNIYKGSTVLNGEQKGVNNIVYTLVPLSTGRFNVKGVKVVADDKVMETKEALITVAAPSKLNFNVSSSYTDVSLYAPSSKVDIDKVIEENLFVKAEVNKTTCYQGEAIVATFKLYSRLQSLSEVVKTPAFYGFTAVDMLDASKPNQSVETVDGKVFNTSILRKVQLYPSRSGKQMIDPITISSLIEFGDNRNDAKKVEVTKEISTPAIPIHVKPLPGKVPEEFDGAVGNFKMKASLQSDKISSSQPGRLAVTLYGQGNFVQFAAPPISWPQGVDVYQLSATEKLDKSRSPLQGEKTYLIGFSTSKIGKGIIPPIRFTFFNPDTKKFETVSIDGLKYEVVGTKATIQNKQAKQVATALKIWIWTGMGILLFVLLAIVMRKKKLVVVEQAEISRRDYTKEMETISSFGLTDKELALKVQQIVYDLLQDRFGTTSINIIEDRLDEVVYKQLQSLLTTCQEIAYTNIRDEVKREALLKEAIQFVRTV